jgi:hypothetical protein
MTPITDDVQPAGERSRRQPWSRPTVARLDLPGTANANGPDPDAGENTMFPSL